MKGPGPVHSQICQLSEQGARVPYTNTDVALPGQKIQHLQLTCGDMTERSALRVAASL